MMIYDLDNEYGGVILGDSDCAAPSLSVNSNAPGQPALAVLSTASGAAVKVTGIDVAGIDVDNGANAIGIDADSSSTTNPAGDFRSSATVGPALIVGRTVNSSSTIAALRILGSSVASAALIEFKGGFISCTSVILTSAANTDYVIPVSINGAVRYIPCFAGAAVQGGAAF